MIKFQTLPTKHIIVNCKVNGFDARMLVDTGAQRTAVCKTRVRHLAVKLDSAAAYELVNHINGSDCEMATVELELSDRLSIEVLVMDLRHVNRAFEKHEQQPIDGIIGADILAGRQAVIDYANETINFRLPKRRPLIDFR